MGRIVALQGFSAIPVPEQQDLTAFLPHVSGLKATYVCGTVYLVTTTLTYIYTEQVHRRVEEAESIAHPESGSALCDLRSDAEMIWSTSSKVGTRQQKKNSSESLKTLVTTTHSGNWKSNQ